LKEWMIAKMLGTMIKSQRLSMGGDTVITLSTKIKEHEACTDSTFKQHLYVGAVCNLKGVCNCTWAFEKDKW